MKKTFKAIVASLICTGAFVGAMPAFAASTVTVQPGENMWSIALQNQVSVQALESANPSVNPSNLLVGTVLNVPTLYTVQSGDTLWKIANKFNISLGAIESANPNVQTQNLTPGTQVVIPGQSSSSSSVSRTTIPSTPGTDINSQNLYWMAHVINAEAEGESLQAQIGVGDVVFHRLEAGSYGNTVKDVVFQQINGAYQFTCVPQGTIYNTPSASAYQAALDVLQKHTDVVPGAFVFFNPAKTPANSWVWNQPKITTIADFIFAK